MISPEKTAHVLEKDLPFHERLTAMRICAVIPGYGSRKGQPTHTWSENLSDDATQIAKNERRHRHERNG
jgi:hypothetical protein